jgi:hypothetical protein
MRWLVDHADPATWAIECTGFGINLVSRNFEFAGLIVVHDEVWWEQFGGSIEANWEAAGIRRYSTQDRAGLAQLVHDAAWSNEGPVRVRAGTSPARGGRRRPGRPSSHHRGGLSGRRGLVHRQRRR